MASTSNTFEEIEKEIHEETSSSVVRKQKIFQPKCKILVKKLDESALSLTKTKGSTGYTLYSIEDTVVPAHGNNAIRTGLALQLPENYFGRIFLSQNNFNRDINVGAGIIDADYRGEIKVILFNHGHIDHVIWKGSEIAQLVICNYLNMEIEEVKNLNETERGDKGFGSTGTKAVEEEVLDEKMDEININEATI